MDIRHLEYFIEVARHKSFSKAAEAIHISQPSISKAIRELENELGVTLLYRNAKGIELTDSGQAILEQAQQIVSSMNNLTARLGEVDNLQQGKIHIGFPPITGVTAFAHLLGKFKQQYPNIEINLYEYGSKKIEQAIQEGLLDMGVICVPEDDNGMYELIPLFKDPLNILLHSRHRLARQAAVDYNDIKEEPFVLYSNDFGLHDMILERCRQAGFQPQVVFKTSQRELMTQAVEAGLGIAFLPSRICQAIQSDELVIRPLVDPGLCLELAIAWKKGRYVSHTARALIRFARDHMAD